MVDPDSMHDAFVKVQSGMIGAAAGIVGYLVKVVHWGEPWRWPVLVVMYVLVPFMLGHVVESWWPLSESTGKPLPGMAGVIAIVGSSGGVVLVAAQDGMLTLVKRAFAAASDRLK